MQKYSLVYVLDIVTNWLKYFWSFKKEFIFDLRGLSKGTQNFQPVLWPSHCKVL